MKMKMKTKDEKLGRDLIKESGVDVWYDKVFVRHLVKKIQDIDPDIGAVLFPESKLVVFFWKRIIIHKVLLNEDQTENLSIDWHVNEVKKVIKMLKLNLIPIRDLNNIKSQAKKLKLNYGKKLN